jgi:biopolymer transport protein ExbD
MLDMSFQLLAFFIMTFKLAAVEGQITLTEQGSVEVLKDLGTSVPALRDELKAAQVRLASEKQQGKLLLEMDDKLLQTYVAQLLDVGVRMGFSDISPVPINRRGR